jgi:hypothetical protein
MAAELSAAAAQEEDTERRGLLSYAARLIGDSLRDVAVRAAGQVLAPATGLPPGRPAAATLPFGDDALSGGQGRTGPAREESAGRPPAAAEAS